MRRFREFETRAFQPENLDDWSTNGLMTLIQRSMASAERSFHKAPAALAKLQRSRGFVPQKPVEGQATAAKQPTPAGFVPQKTAAELAAFEYFGYFPEDHDEYVEAIVNSRLHARHNTEPSPE